MIPEYLSKGFAEARDASGHYAHLQSNQRPTFHEIRGLGARVYRSKAVEDQAIQALMTHSNKRPTQICLERRAKAPTDADYHAVSAPLTLAEMLGAKAAN